jgi:putative hydrolase of the HAD superfamily
MGIAGHFDHLFLSHETGFYKPEPAAYLRVIHELALEPHQILFFDDRPENVTAACGAGMSARVVNGPAAIRAVIEPPGR